jgi:uncharacterized protein (TIGR01370 family)
MVLGYVSIGEVYDDAPEMKALKAKGALLPHSDIWSSYIVDITSPEWQPIVLKYVDDVAAQGFDGVMLDTVDSPLYWAQTQAPKRLEAMQDAAVELIHAIHKAHPAMKIMLNRGFSVLPRVAQDIDYALAESIMVNTDVSTGQFELFPASTYIQVAEQLHEAGVIAPHLKVFTLDYWDQDDVKGLATIYSVQRAQGFIPYVTSTDLRTFTPEPRNPPEK